MQGVKAHPGDAEDANGRLEHAFKPFWKSISPDFHDGSEPPWDCNQIDIPAMLLTL